MNPPHHLAILFLVLVLNYKPDDPPHLQPSVPKRFVCEIWMNAQSLVSLNTGRELQKMQNIDLDSQNLPTRH
jgi:hypothetical protein